jgi:hypothetical protein
VEACREGQKKLNDAEDAFVERVKKIRSQHLLLVDYDREMIAALTTYRDQMRSVLDADEELFGNRFRCAGQPLADLRLSEQPKLQSVGQYLLSFERALKEDPPDAYLP